MEVSVGRLSRRSEKNDNFTRDVSGVGGGGVGFGGGLVWFFVGLWLSDRGPVHSNEKVTQTYGEGMTKKEDSLT